MSIASSMVPSSVDMSASEANVIEGGDDWSTVDASDVPDRPHTVIDIAASLPGVHPEEEGAKADHMKAKSAAEEEAKHSAVRAESAAEEDRKLESARKQSRDEESSKHGEMKAAIRSHAQEKRQQSACCVQSGDGRSCCSWC